MPVPLVKRNELLRIGTAENSSKDLPFIRLTRQEPWGSSSVTIYSDCTFFRRVDHQDEICPNKAYGAFDSTNPPNFVRDVLETVKKRQRLLPLEFEVLKATI